MDSRVLLATFCLMPEGEPGGSLLVDALAERGVEAAWATWDDPAVDWAGAFPAWDAPVAALLASRFGHTRFRPLQRMNGLQISIFQLSTLGLLVTHLASRRRAGLRRL